MKLFIGFCSMILCWLVSCIVGTLIVGVILPATGSPITAFDGLAFVAIGWIVSNVNNLVEPEYKTWFNIWMSLIYVPTLLSVL